MDPHYHGSCQKNDKQSLKSPIPIYSEKVQTPLGFAVNKLSA